MGRKYRQDGYQGDSEERSKVPRTQGKPLREGPRSPRMPGFHKVMRCSMCGVPLPPSFGEVTRTSQCPKCQSYLHTCKSCVYLDPGSRFECTQPIPQRIARKNEQNSCEFFEARTTVEKDTTSGSEKPQDARDAFQNLFKK